MKSLANRKTQPHGARNIHRRYLRNVQIPDASVDKKSHLGTTGKSENVTKKTLQISQIDSNSNIKLSNSECIYVLTAIDKYALVQIKNNFDYPGIKLTTEPGSTNVYLLEYEGKNITGAVLLWSYPETYSYKQMNVQKIK